MGGAWVQRPKTLHILFYISETNGQRRDCTPFKTKSHLQTMSPNVQCSIPLQHLTMSEFRKFPPFLKIFHRINLIIIEIVILVVKNVSFFGSFLLSKLKPSDLSCTSLDLKGAVQCTHPIHHSPISNLLMGPCVFYTAKWVGSGLLCMSKI